MPGGSSNPDGWWSLLEPAPAELFFSRGDGEDPRLGDTVQRWAGGPIEFRTGQAVLIGFPCDEGVRRNGGRQGAAAAPDAIRRMLYRSTTWDPVSKTDLTRQTYVDLGNIHSEGQLEGMQARLGQVVGAILERGGTPIIFGGGHETAFGHYLGYAHAEIECGIINIDAHLDVRPYDDGAHSGSPFRQAMELAGIPLRPECYCVVGAQRDRVACVHQQYVEQRGGRILWHDPDRTIAQEVSLVRKELVTLREQCGCSAVMLTVDADAFRQADVPGVSAPNPAGFDGRLWPELALAAGQDPLVKSLDIVEVNPRFDRDEQTARWAALGIRQFLVGLAGRAK